MSKKHIDALAEYFGLELRLKHDSDASAPFSVWCWDPTKEDESNADVIGFGRTAIEALDAARDWLVKCCK